MILVMLFMSPDELWEPLPAAFLAIVAHFDDVHVRKGVVPDDEAFEQLVAEFRKVRWRNPERAWMIGLTPERMHVVRTVARIDMPNGWGTTVLEFGATGLLLPGGP